MKKIALILTLLLLFSGFSLAEGIDLKGLSDEELQQLEKNVNVELYDRGLNSQNLIYQGAYVVGQDIKSGTYLISSAINRGITYCVFDNASDYELMMRYYTKPGTSMVLPNTDIGSSGSGRVELKDGNVFFIPYEGMIGRLEIQQADWMP